jgi:uncharacterized membrane protein YbhN (UPF0104 family)
MKKIYHTGLLILSMALLIGLGFYVNKNSHSLLHVTKVSPLIILGMFSLHAINYLFLGLTHKLPMEKHQIFLKPKEWFGLCMSGELFNLLLPAKGGTAIRMVYMKEKKDLSMKAFLSMGFAIVLTGFSMLGIVGTVYCHFFLKKSHPVFFLLECVFISLSISGFILMFLTESISKFFKFKRKVSPKFYLSDYKLTTKCTLLYIGMFVIYPLKVYLSFKAIGTDIRFIDSFEISLVLLAASLFQVLPGNMGVKELATAYIASQYGISFETALLASLIDRAILFIFIFPIGSYFYWDLFLERKLPSLKSSEHILPVP